MTSEWIDTWVKIGQKNPWISEANDPYFGKHMFVNTEQPTPEALADIILKARWCLGQPFYWKDICLINQIDGGSEWKVIKQGLSFESWSAEWMGRERLIDHIQHVDRATLEQCANWTYMEA